MYADHCCYTCDRLHGRVTVTQSMTGFARASVTTGAVTVTVECRSVNNRYLDLHFRMPDNLRSIESALRNKANEYCSRGKLEFVIRTMDTDCDAPTAINTARLSALQGTLGQIETPSRSCQARPAGPPTCRRAGRARNGPGHCAPRHSQPPRTVSPDSGKSAARGGKLAEMIRQRVDVMRGHLQDLHKQLPASNRASPEATGQAENR